jgi:sensor histidine kinase YesM
MSFRKGVFMKKLSLIKVLGVFSVFYSFGISFADPDVLVKGSRAMSPLIGNVNQQNVDAFGTKMRGVIDGLKRHKSGKIQLKIAYLNDLMRIVERVLEYQNLVNQNQVNQQLRNELESIAKTYGGEVYRLIWSVIPPVVLVAPAGDDEDQ